MYVSYLLEKDGSMYANSGRHPGLNLNPQTFVPAPPPPPPPPPAPQYSDFTGYHHHHHHHVPGVSSEAQTGTWSPGYPTREDWAPYSTGPAPPAPNPGHLAFSPPEFSPVQPPGLLPPTVGQLSPSAPRRNPYEWMRRNTAPPNP
ncbi:hypothetical protein SRHO_G00224610, partial [Serrasalmus rhombeus]